MRYELKCKCGATCWVHGDYDPSVNALELNDNEEREWEGGDANCPHDNYEIGEGESDDDEFYC